MPSLNGNAVSNNLHSKKELWYINIKQAIQGLFTAGTSPERKRSVANGD
jgi:hypothetical protein